MSGFDFAGALEDQRLHDAQRRLILAALRVAAHDFAASGGTVEGDRHQLAEEDALHQAARDLVDLIEEEQ
jgi:hypothetical protein